MKMMKIDENKREASLNREFVWKFSFLFKIFDHLTCIPKIETFRERVPMYTNVLNDIFYASRFLPLALIFVFISFNLF